MADIVALPGAVRPISVSAVIRAREFVGNHRFSDCLSENRWDCHNGSGLCLSRMADQSRELRVFAPALILLANCALINYVDRGNLSIATPLLKDELHISVTQLGILLSAFFLDLHRDAVRQWMAGGQV